MNVSTATRASYMAVIFNHRRVAGSILFLLTAVGIGGLIQLDFSDNPRDIYLSKNTQSRLLDDVHARFGADDSGIVVVLESEHLMTRASLSRVQAFVAALKEEPSLQAVHSLFDARRPVRLGRRTVYFMVPGALDQPEVDFEPRVRTVMEHPLLRERFVSADGRTCLVVAEMGDQSFTASEIQVVVERVRSIVKEYFGGSSIRARLTGQPLLRVDTFHNLKTDQFKFSVMCGATLFCIALLLFRKLQPVLVALAGPTVGVVWTVGAMGWLGQKFDGINVVLPMLLFVIGFTDSVHLVMSLRRSGRSRVDPRTRALRAVGEVGWACLMTSITTAIGFGSLFLSSMAAVYRFGIYAACGVLLLFCAVITVGPLLSTMPWFRDLGDDRSPGRTTTGEPSHGGRYSSAIRRLTDRAGTISLIGVGLCIAMGIIGKDIPFDMRWSEALPDSGETVETIQHLDETFGGSVTALVLVQWPEGLYPGSDLVLEFTNAIHQRLERLHNSQQEGSIRIGRPTSVLTLLEGLRGPDNTLASRFAVLRKRAPERLSRLIDPTNRQLLIGVPIPDAGARALLPVFDSIEDELRDLNEEWPGFKSQLTGSTVLSARNLHKVLSELVESILLAAAIVFAVVCLAFRSLRIGLISIVPNTFPLCVVTATLSVADIPMQVTAALTLCLCLGIAVDDTIHLVARFRREQLSGRPPRDACMIACRYVGKVIILTTVILMCGFGTFLLSGSPAIRLFGMLACVALVAALIGDLVFLPALLVRYSAQQDSPSLSGPD